MRNMSMTPDYEVRLLLDAAVVLDTGHELKSAVLSAFGMPAVATRMNVLFLDTSCKDLCCSNWSARIRRIENTPSLELTYKKRFDITGGDIDEAITLAHENGFDGSDKTVDAHVEWGYMKQTLVVTRDKTTAAADPATLELPGTRDARRMLVEEAPERFDNWGCQKWGTCTVETSRIFGPVTVRRSVGMWKGLKLRIEVWSILDAAGIGFDYIVEASFRTSSRGKAATEQANLQAFLMDKGWFVAGDSSKTQLIMDRYGCYPGLENTDLKET
ncbi:MFS monocarboxylate transporter [Purpureocillium lavendulum]|uniref:MFS monocarboxylate transporter n=1 Tax=Purpureocillium lavendulum TaxID=1247861 RepID=A0AB34G6P7_9HYPO|nr:MFS monocarboxylate transporter [Purpureocillium lavendulum]